MRRKWLCVRNTGLDHELLEDRDHVIIITPFNEPMLQHSVSSLYLLGGPSLPLKQGDTLQENLFPRSQSLVSL